jgi:hypothetical protein
MDMKLRALREIAPEYSRLVSLCRQYVHNPERYGAAVIAQFSEIVWSCAWCRFTAGKERPDECPACHSRSGRWVASEESYLVLSPQKPRGYKPMIYTQQDLFCDASLWVQSRWGKRGLNCWELRLWDFELHEIGQRLNVHKSTVCRTLQAIRCTYDARFPVAEAKVLPLTFQ